MKYLSLLLVLLLALPATAADEAPEAPVPQPGAGPLPTGDVLAHDPVMIRAENGTYHLFTTGPGVAEWTSPDLRCWTLRGPVFEETPDWVMEKVPDFTGHFWAPDIARHDGTYYLYYSVSSFGKNRSAIGLVTNTTLDADDPDYRWVDHGKVVESFPGLNNWNAIDAAYIEDEDGTPYLSWGSFWSGLKIAQLTPERDALVEEADDYQTIASRVPDPAAPMPSTGYPEGGGAGAIEAPFIFEHGDHYYLFASTDLCCRGPESTYKIVVGRSETLLGDYVDREGVSMVEGGGTLVLEGGPRWYGVGHNAVYRFDGEDYLVFHGYDATTNPPGRPRLRIERLRWDDEGWPEVDPENTPDPTASCP